MSGFFKNLLARSRTDAGVVRPRIPSMFEAPQAADATPLEETSISETAARPMQDAIERPVAPLAATPVGEPQTRVDTQPPSVEVQAFAELPRERRVSSEPAEERKVGVLRRGPSFDATPARIFSNSPSLSVSMTEESPNSLVTSEIHETREVHETIREQRTLVDRTFLERVAQAGRRSPQAQAANPPAINAEPEIHVSIGRIEVRAVNETPTARKTPPQSSAVMGLDEYLRQKTKGAAQ